VTSIAPGYLKYQQRTEREIPLMILEPMGGAWKLGSPSQRPASRLFVKHGYPDWEAIGVKISDEGRTDRVVS
jgi:hypothetical protein